MKNFQKCLFAVAFFVSAISCQNTNQSAEMIITNAKIWTGNESQPLAEAMAFMGDTIIAVGSNRDIMKLKSDNTGVTDLEGKFVIPGIIDSHLHFLQGGLNLSSVQLRDASTPEEFIMRLAEFAATVKPGTWITGGEWDGKGWETLPERSWIDSVTPDNPVFVERLDGHMALANSLAMKLAGIDRKVKDVKGGTIVRNEAGELTGIFKDNAMNYIFSRIPSASDEQIDKALLAAMNYFASNGVTSVHAVDAASYADAIERVRNDGKLITRVYIMETISRWEKLQKQVARDGRGDKWMRTGGLKGFIDGSLGSHTAAFLEPYTDMITDSGLLVNSREDLYTWISNADKADLQVGIHAIGDRAINTMLNIYEQVENENGMKDRRFRIEHAQHIAPGDVERYAKLNVVACMQPYHAIDDGRWAEPLIGPERVKSMYVFKSLFDAGAVVAFGSDWPVAPATPLEGIYAAATRRTLDDKNPDGWVPEQKITVEQALKAYTKNAAYASFEENVKGTLEAGKLADFVVLDMDITAIDPVMIREVKVLKTYVGGRKIFEIEKSKQE
jgi:hypothetical protein